MAGGRPVLIAGILSFLVFTMITTLVFSNTTQRLDAQFALIINNFNPGAILAGLLILAANYGREYFWIPLVAIMLIFGDRNTKLLAIELAALFIVGIAFGEAAKQLLYRQRPFDVVNGIQLRIASNTDSSFPSGHALIVAIGAAFSLLKFKNRIIALLFTLEAAVVCYSRIYVGMHYTLDVIAGVSLAVGIVGVGLFILERYSDSSLKRITSFVLRLFKDGALKL